MAYKVDHDVCGQVLAHILEMVKPVTTAKERANAHTYLYCKEATGAMTLLWLGPDGVELWGDYCCEELAHAFGWAAWLTKMHPDLVPNRRAAQWNK